jgi:hypothetical protein
MLLKTSAAAAGATYRGPNPTQYPQMVAGDIPQEEIPPLEEAIINLFIYEPVYFYALRLLYYRLLREFHKCLYVIH